MILGKFWAAFRAQVNKLANLFHGSDPIAQMQYEYDSAVAQLREGRQGLEQYRALVERVSRQVADNKAQVNNLEAKVKLYLQNGNRDMAGKFALELQKAKKQLEEDVKSIEELNSLIGESNSRALQVLTEVSGQNLGADRKAWDWKPGACWDEVGT